MSYFKYWKLTARASAAREEGTPRQGKGSWLLALTTAVPLCETAQAAYILVFHLIIALCKEERPFPSMYFCEGTPEIRKGSSGTAAETNNTHLMLFDYLFYKAMLSGGVNTH